MTWVILSREVQCSPCTKILVRDPGVCDSTLMIVHVEGHAWCSACGTKRELGAEVIKEPKS